MKQDATTTRPHAGNYAGRAPVKQRAATDWQPRQQLLFVNEARLTRRRLVLFSASASVPNVRAGRRPDAQRIFFTVHTSDLLFIAIEHTNFYFGGYYQSRRPKKHEVVAVQREGHESWMFSPKSFDSFRREIEDMTKWRYSGGTDFILANARYDLSAQTARLDFHTAVCFTFERMKEEGVLLEASMLFEKIFQHAEKCNGVDPAWGFSDREGVALAGSALKSLLLSALPKSVQKQAQAAFHFVSKDIEK